MFKISSIKVGMKYQEVRNSIMKSSNLIIKSLPDSYNGYVVVVDLITNEKVFVLRDFNTGIITDVTKDI